jgi:hypothetical protein
MKQPATHREMFHLVQNADSTKYDGKTVEFIFDRDRALSLLTGRFVFHSGPNHESMDIYYIGRLDPLDPPFACYVFQLSRAHLESTIRANKPGAKVDFIMERPLWCYDRINPTLCPPHRT